MFKVDKAAKQVLDQLLDVFLKTHGLSGVDSVAQIRACIEEIAEEEVEEGIKKQPPYTVDTVELNKKEEKVDAKK